MVDISVLMFSQMMIHIIAWCHVVLIGYPNFYSGAVTLIVTITYLRLLWIGKNDGNILEYPDWLLFCRDYNLVCLFNKDIQR